MLDHVFTDAIDALRVVLEAAYLERQAFEERFQTDFLLGDVSWETTYGLPGEGLPPRVRADISLGWSTWSQTSYRNWYIGEPSDELPRIDIEIVLRIQRLAEQPDPRRVLHGLPETSPPIGNESLQRSGPTVELIHGETLDDVEYAIEVSYEGQYEIDEEALEDGTTLDKHFSAMGGWISSTLVKLGDLNLVFLPPELEPDGD
jgi:hypothetical protein